MVAGMAVPLNDTAASGGSAVQFGVCNNFCSNPKSPIFRTPPVSINHRVMAAWCGPTWDASQAEFDLARQKLGQGGILMPPCQPPIGYKHQPPEQYKVALDKAAKAGVKILIFPGYKGCTDGNNHSCYLGMTDIDAAIDMYATHPGMAGLFIVDEPEIQSFPALKKAVDRMAERRPGLLAYANMHGSLGTLSAKPHYGRLPNDSSITYDEYVSEYVRTIKSPVLSVDDYASPDALRLSLSTIDKWAKHWQANGRPELSNRTLWSAIMYLGSPGRYNYREAWVSFPLYQAVNDDFKAMTYYFTWRSPPRLGQPDTGPGLCGKENNYKPATMCGN